VQQHEPALEPTGERLRPAFDEKKGRHR
jgi:hypothetical protein